MLSKKLKGNPGTFQASNFTATQWNTAEDKARMADKLTKFILNGFQQGSFTKEMYKRLSTMFGHIAEYNIHGFYTVWFDDDAAWTWSDVERAIQKWLSDNRIVEKISGIINQEAELPLPDESRMPTEIPQNDQLTLFRADTIGETND